MANGPLRGVRILISGAGVVGPALAHWLSRYGATTTVVEIAPALRTSGFAVDFRGPTHLRVLSEMGVLDELRRAETHGGAMRCVDEHGRVPVRRHHHWPDRDRRSGARRLRPGRVPLR
jgi:2-polyprenyl-6-methoxyphenol hydroxylase-like FAD-dependent oxidoreductase